MEIKQGYPTICSIASQAPSPGVEWSRSNGKHAFPSNT